MTSCAALASVSSTSASASALQDSRAAEVLGASCTATIQSGASIVDNFLYHEEIAPIHDHTTSVNRSYSDLHQGEFVFYAFALCAVRTAVQQPINLALARKQTCARANAVSTRQLLRAIFLQEGRWAAVCAGMPALTLGCALSEAVYLGLFECLREQLPIRSDATRDAVSGYLSDVVCRTIHIPLSVIAFRQMTSVQKTPPCSWHGYDRTERAYRQEARPSHKKAVSRLHLSPYEAYQHPQYQHPKSRMDRAHNRYPGDAGRGRPSAWSTLKTLHGERGLRSVFAGFGTTLVVGCQWTAMWWALYGQVKAELYLRAQPALRQPADADTAPRARVSETPAPSWARAVRSCAHVPDWCLAADDNVVLNTAASVVTSAATAVLFNPYLVVRTNLQVTPNSTLWSVTRSVWQSRGVAGFYSGLALSINACIIEGALASWSYEYAKLWSDRTKD